jgi:hypothetical protein
MRQVTFPDLLVPTYSYREERDYREDEADLYEDHAADCECSLCVTPESEE